MAIKVENTAVLVFGILDTETIATHGRFKKTGANDNTRVTRPLAAAVTVGAGERLRIPADSFDVVYKTGQLVDKHMDAMVKAYWDGETFEVDLMTDATTVITTTGYSQQSTAAWSFTTEND